MSAAAGGRVPGRAGGGDMSTNQTAGRFACGTCGRRYRWKPELAGRSVRCACGRAMTYPLGEPAGDEADLYDVAPDVDAPPPDVAVPRPGAPGLNSLDGSRAAPIRALTYRRPTADTGGVDSYFPNKTIDFHGPLWLIGGSVLVEFVAAYMSMPPNVTGARAVTAALTGVGIEMVVGTVLMLVGVLIAV